MSEEGLFKEWRTGSKSFLITDNCPHGTWKNNVTGRNHLLLRFFSLSPQYTWTTGHFFCIPLPFKDKPPWLFHTDTGQRNLDHKVKKPYLTEKSTLLFFFYTYIISSTKKSDCLSATSVRLVLQVGSSSNIYQQILAFVAVISIFAKNKISKKSNLAPEILQENAIWRNTR